VQHEPGSSPFGALIWTSFDCSNLSHVKVRGGAVETPYCGAGEVRSLVAYKRNHIIEVVDGHIQSRAARSGGLAIGRGEICKS
jgi:hypothetical protein